MKRKVVHLKDREVKADTQNGKVYSFLSNGLRETNPNTFSIDYYF